MDLAFETVGHGPPVVMLHGLFASAASWRDVAQALSFTRRVFSVDLRNHGRSPRAVDMSYTAMADDVLRLIEQQRLDRPALVGHSMGGKVAMALALSAPHAVGPVVAIDIAPVAYADRWSTQLQSLSDVLGHAPVPHAADDAPFGIGSGVMLPRLATRNAYVDWRSNLSAIGLSIHELCAFPRHLRYLNTDAPLHAIVGGRSDLVRPATADAFAPMFPRASVEVIPDAGHWVHADQPAALVRSLRRALDQRSTILS